MAGWALYEEAMGESTAEEIEEEKSALSFHQSEAVSHIEIASDQSGSCKQASCRQKVDVGSCFLQQSCPSSQDCTRDMLLHDPHVDSIEMCAEERLDNETEELHSEASIIFKAHASKALDMTLAPCTSKLFSLHFFDERGADQSGLLKANYWAACPLLLPQQVAPLALYDALKSVEYMWMRSTLLINRNLMSVRAPYNAYINFSTLEEHLQISGLSLASWISIMIHSKEHAYLAKKVEKFSIDRARRVDDHIMHLALSPFDDVKLTVSTVSLDAQERTIDDLDADTGKHSFSSHLPDLELKSDVGHTHDNEDDGDVGEVIGSDYGTSELFHDGHNGTCVSGSQSSIGLSDEFEARDAAQSREFDADDDYTSHFRFADHEDSIADSAIEIGVFHERSICVDDHYYDFYDQSNTDMRYGEPHWFPEVDSRYFNANDGVSSGYTHFDASFGDDDAVCGDTIFDDHTEVHGSSPETKQDTWWDDDAVFLDTQVREENDSMEQAWQVL